MAALQQVLAVLILSVICVVGGALTVKGFYCRDPDTGKLYPVNTTWPSSSFCGSYTCKLRKKNMTEADYVQLRQINITKLKEIDGKPSFRSEVTFNVPNKNKNKTANLPEFEAERILYKDKSNNFNELRKEDVKNITLEKIKNIELLAKTKDGDRYLTQTEIRALTELLHAVKKSDIEAIVEIYNLAQDIYREVDKAADENILEEAIRDENRGKETTFNKDNARSLSHVSYWYEPLNYANKAKLSVEVKPIPVKSKPTEKLLDMTYEGSKSAAFIAPPLNYYKGAQRHQDFAKLPFYYPISNFQRIASYVHPTTYKNVATEYKKPCKSNVQNNVQPPWINKIILKKPFPNDLQKSVQTMRTPYPFAFVQYNASLAPNTYFNGVPWTYMNLYNKDKKPLPYVSTSYVAQIPNAVLVNPNLHEQVQDIEQKSLQQNIAIDRPDWQTDEISPSVLEEVRANMAARTKLFPFPLRKKVKLERVGKVIKLDEFTRSKREAIASSNKETNENFEAYIEKSTCQSDTEPGFFRVGNLTQPFPACCPQRIGKR